VTALICTPDIKGVEIYQKNRSKCGIRGTWQARIRFKNARIPKANLAPQGRQRPAGRPLLPELRAVVPCPRHAGSARTCMDQSIKWAQTRYQFKRRWRFRAGAAEDRAHGAHTPTAIDSILYFTTGILDRHDNDNHGGDGRMPRSSAPRWGWRVINDAMQIMGGGRLHDRDRNRGAFRDARIYLIVKAPTK